MINSYSYDKGPWIFYVQAVIYFSSLQEESDPQLLHWVTCNLCRDCRTPYAEDLLFHYSSSLHSSHQPPLPIISWFSTWSLLPSVSNSNVSSNGLFTLRELSLLSKRRIIWVLLLSQTLLNHPISLWSFPVCSQSPIWQVHAEAWGRPPNLYASSLGVTIYNGLFLCLLWKHASMSAESPSEDPMPDDKSCFSATSVKQKSHLTYASKSPFLTTWPHSHKGWMSAVYLWQPQEIIFSNL